jgi:hypothetical protein
MTVGSARKPWESVLAVLVVMLGTPVVVNSRGRETSGRRGCPEEVKRGSSVGLCEGAVECWRGCAGVTCSRPPTALTEKGLYGPRKIWSGDVRYGDTPSPSGDIIDDVGVLYMYD